MTAANAQGSIERRDDETRARQTQERANQTQDRAHQTQDSGTWEARLEAALRDANLPTLLMVLVQLTGETGWLAPRFQCSRAQGLDDNDTGGLDEAARAEVLTAASDAIRRWKHGRGPTPPPLGHDLLTHMMRVSTGERVPDGFGAIVAAGLGLDPTFALDQRANFAVPEGFRVAIIGAGVAGLCAAIRLQNAGVPYVVFEKNDGLGGTWHENRYPGCGVDTPSHIYSFSFAKHDWTAHFALQPEIRAYLDGVADRFDVRGNICFGTRVESACYDERSMRWTVRTVDAAGRCGETAANILIGAVGYLNVPRLGAIEGLGDFSGPCFHTARWPQDLDLAGKRVAVIGNGASAMQVVPQIAPQVASLTVFARSKQWAAPFDKFRMPIASGVRFLLQEVPFYPEWYRQRLLWIFNDRIHASLQIDPAWEHPERAVNRTNDRHRAFFTDYIKAEIGARQDLLADLLPDYPPFGKRMLMDNGWFRTMTRDNVHLVTAPIARVTSEAIEVQDGRRIAADVLMVATGFDAINMLASFDLRGRGGLSIREAWKTRGAEAFMGLTVPGFPNFFMLSGPNTGLGHGGSGVDLIESHVGYVLGVLQKALAEYGGDVEIEVKPEVFAAYNARVQDAHERMIWSHKGMTNWYRNAAGRVVMTTPFRNDENWHFARRAGLDDFVVRVPAGGRARHRR